MAKVPRRSNPFRASSKNASAVDASRAESPAVFTRMELTAPVGACSAGVVALKYCWARERLVSAARSARSASHASDAVLKRSRMGLSATCVRSSGCDAR